MDTIMQIEVLKINEKNDGIFLFENRQKLTIFSEINSN